MVKTYDIRNELLSDAGKATLSDRYLYNGENYQDLFKRVSEAYSDSPAHAQRLYDYVSQMWFMPATPILTNGGLERGLPISCYLNEAEDSLEGIINLWNENCWLAAKGGGIGSYWGNLRSIGEKVHNSGKTSGVIPFMKVQDAMTLAVSQGSIRRGSAAVYLDVHHPEIEEFVNLRRPTGGDVNRRCLNLHHGVVVDDKFMESVVKGDTYDLVSPKNGDVCGSIDARSLWIEILTSRLETGEPYIIFKDNVNRNRPYVQKLLDLKIKMSNLCSEITLPTGKDHLGNERTAVCCLSSLNLEYYDMWSNYDSFIEDIMRFLDNVLQDFIDRAPSTMNKAVYSAQMERSVGLGAMGFHSYLQSLQIPWESAVAKSLNIRVFKHIKHKVDEASLKIGEEKGACPDRQSMGSKKRFTNTMAIAPTASISLICGDASPGIEPYMANAYTQKTLSGSFVMKNKHLDKLIQEVTKTRTEACYTPEDIWHMIQQNGGSIQDISMFTEKEKLVFKTATEIDQKWLVEFAADRQKFISQSQSLNLFLPPNTHKKYLSDLHYLAWRLGVKSLYYLRSTSKQRVEKSSDYALKNTDYEECMSCQ